MTENAAAYYEVKDNIAYVYLNRPEQINAFNVAMRDDLHSIFTAIHIDDSLKAVIISGNGEKGFCSGADLTEFGSTPSRVVAREARYLRDVWDLVQKLPIPSVAILHGYTIGSGLELAMCCDFRVADFKTQFRLPEVALAMLPFATGSQTLPRLIGKPKALELLLTSKWFSAEQASDLGLINRLAEHNQLSKVAKNLIFELIDKPPTALKFAKQAIKRGVDIHLSDGLLIEQRLAESIFSLGMSQQK